MNSITRIIICQVALVLIALTIFNSLPVDAIVESQTNKSLDQLTLNRQEEVETAAIEEPLQSEQRAILGSSPNGYQSLLNKNSFLFGSLAGNRNRTSFNTQRDIRDSRSFSTLTQLIRPTLYRPSLFHVVKFPNDECYDATNQTGVCYTAFECKAYGGTGSTACAKGFGTCCSINRSCNQVTSQKVTYFMNPSYPQADTTTSYCPFTIEVQDPDVCQIRLDFMDFNMDQPVDGRCSGDKMTVTAGGLNAKSIPILCGMNKDQHMYVNIPRSSSSYTVTSTMGTTGSSFRSASLLIQTNGSGAYKWRIRVTQVNCVRNPAESGIYGTSSSGGGGGLNLNEIASNQGRSMSTVPIYHSRAKRMIGSKLRFLPVATLKVTHPAPSGCLQYFTEPMGTISSFNYGKYLANTDYAICIERSPTTCKVTFRPVEKFGIYMSSGVRQNFAGVGDSDCLYDYLSIPGGAFDGMKETKDRRCGSVLSNVHGDSISQTIVTRTNGPIVLRFHTSDIQDRSVNQGFKIQYEQSSNCEINGYSDPGLGGGPFGTTNMLNRMPNAISATVQAAAMLYDGQGSAAPIDEDALGNKITLDRNKGFFEPERESRSVLRTSINETNLKL